ncbi:MAG: YkvA family protein [Actinomycetota bacterium]
MAGWWEALLAVGIALVAVWLALVMVLLLVKPKRSLLAEVLRLLPDLLRLLRRLAADAGVPRRVRLRLGLLLAYLAIPIDLIPDFVPVLGYADDAIIVTLALRSTVRSAGLETVRTHWPGTDDGFAALCRLTGLPTGHTADAGDDPRPTESANKI